MEGDPNETKAPLLPEQEQVIRDEWIRIVGECGDLDSSSVQVFGFQNGKFVADRTGVLFRVADSHFLITAAHKLVNIHGLNIPLFLPPSQQDATPISLSGRMLYTKDRRVDIAVSELPQSIVERLLPTRTFLGMMDVDLQSHSAPGLYLILGYPSSCTEITAEAVRPTVLKYAAIIYSGDTDGLENFDPTLHLLLQHDEVGRDAAGQPLLSPAIEGMSGGGIWRLLELKPAWNQTWKRSDAKLVAIQNRYIRNQYCKGTWVRHAIQLIWDSFPLLRPALRLHSNGLQ